MVGYIMHTSCVCVCMCACLCVCMRVWCVAHPFIIIFLVRLAFLRDRGLVRTDVVVICMHVQCCSVMLDAGDSGVM